MSDQTAKALPDKMPRNKAFFTREYFETIKEGSRKSAEEIIPFIMELTHPKSVVDVGCGEGIWLAVFQEQGVEDILGIDGNYINKDGLAISSDHFLPLDLTKLIKLDRQFDLVVSLEVAQYIPLESAEIFVSSLTKLGPIILFSASVPLQGESHPVNEQWPDFWVRHFIKKGYMVVDNIRKKVWENDNVEWWYAQNTLLFIEKSHLDRFLSLKMEATDSVNSQISIVHPKNYLAKANPLNWSLRVILSVLPILVLNSLKARLQNILHRIMRVNQS